MPDEGISKRFDNEDFGYYKVTVERPSRKAAQFTPERIATLRFVPAISEWMAWAYQRWGDAIYNELTAHKQAIEEHLEHEEANLSAKNRKRLLDPKVWQSQRQLMEVAERVMAVVGQALQMDFNPFRTQVQDALKQLQLKLSASEKNQIQLAG